MRQVTSFSGAGASRRTARRTLPAAIAAVLGLAGAAVPAAAQVSCGERIGPGAEVILSEHLACDGDGAALVVTGPATLDLGEFSITCADRDGDGTVPRVGILVLGSGVTLRGGAVDACHNGIVVAGAGRHRLHDVAALSGTGDGIVLASDGNRLTEALAFFQDGVGIAVHGRDNVVADSSATGNRTGFRVVQRSTLERNFASANEGDGFVVGGSGSVLTDNRAIVSRVGFTVAGAGNRLVRNDGSKNLIGIFLDPRGRENALVANVARQNTVAGIVASGAGNRILLNRVEDNMAHGVRVTSTASTTAVTGNVALRNGASDLADETPGCGGNRWRNNRFEVRNQSCVE